MRVHGRGGLVEEDDQRVVQQRADQGDFLAHALGVLAEAAVAGVDQVEAAQQLIGAGVARGGRHAVRGAEEGEVVQARMRL